MAFPGPPAIYIGVRTRFHTPSLGVLLGKGQLWSVAAVPRGRQAVAGAGGVLSHGKRLLRVPPGELLAPLSSVHSPLSACVLPVRMPFLFKAV